MTATTIASGLVEIVELPNLPSLTPPTSMAAHLPPELFLYIFSLASANRSALKVEPGSTQEVDHVKADWKLYRSLSLVCGSWKEPGQVMLWKTVLLMDPAGLERLLWSPALGDYCTESLIMLGDEWSNEGLGNEDVERAILGLKGMRRLMLSGFEKLPFRVMRLPTLFGLENLEVEASSFSFSSEEDRTVLPYSLKSLYFITVWSGAGTSFTPFQSSALSKLFLDFMIKTNPSDSSDEVVNLLQWTAPRLVELRILWGASHPSILPCLRQLSSLQVLHLNFREDDLVEILNHIPTQINTLFLHSTILAWSTAPTISSLLPIPSLAKLSTLCFPQYTRSTLLGYKDVGVVVESLEARGVELVFKDANL